MYTVIRDEGNEAYSNKLGSHNLNITKKSKHSRVFENKNENAYILKYISQECMWIN